MQQPHDRDREIRTLRERLSRLSEASLRINESLDFDTVLQDVVDSARDLTGSRYGAITVLGEAGQQPDFIVSGLTRDEHQGLWEMPQGLGFFQYLSGLTTPLRLSNITSYFSALGMGGFVLPVPASALLVAPIRHRGVGVGTIYLGHETEGREFSQEDEETLVMFASQAALVIANSRRYREERRARNDLETLVNTSPVGVVVFDAALGAPLSFNREARRIMDGLRDPDQEVDELLEVVSFQRADGREISLSELPLARALSTGETVRAEEMVISRPRRAQRHHPDQRHPHTVRGGRRGGHGGDPPGHDAPGGRPAPAHRVPQPGQPRAPGAADLHQGLRRRVNLRQSRQLPGRRPRFSAVPVRIIDVQADHILDLVGNLLDMARIESGQLAVSPEPADLGRPGGRGQERLPGRPAPT